MSTNFFKRGVERKRQALAKSTETRNATTPEKKGIMTREKDGKDAVDKLIEQLTADLENVKQQMIVSTNRLEELRSVVAAGRLRRLSGEAYDTEDVDRDSSDSKIEPGKIDSFTAPRKKRRIAHDIVYVNLDSVEVKVEDKVEDKVKDKVEENVEKNDDKELDADTSIVLKVLEAYGTLPAMLGL